MRADSDGKEVRFAIQDTGPGLSAEHQRHLFRPFWQARRDGREGAGLGWASGVESSRSTGAGSGESEEGAGTTVFFALPAAEERRAERQG